MYIVGVVALLCALHRCVLSSFISLDVGSGAASQLIREALHHVLTTPRATRHTLATHERPLLASLVNVVTVNRVAYSNVTLRFYPDTVRVKASNVRVESVSNVSANVWPMSFGDEIVNVSVQLGDVEMAARLEGYSARILSCSLRDPLVDASSRNFWITDRILSLASRPLQNNFQRIVCPIISRYIDSIDSNAIKNISLEEVIPLQYRSVFNDSEPILFYRINAISIAERHAVINAQLEWNETAMFGTNGAFTTNGTDVELEWDTDERVAVWIDDVAINEMLDQIEWDFQWMEEQIPVSSPAIPLSSREFLTTLCTSCYFLLNVWAKGPPVILATNNSIVLEKRDRLNLRVVNPDRNVTSVFVSMVLTINAELRPTFDSGTLRTQVQLLDTNVIMERGAFPPSWSFFVQDLMRGMILEMMWPELKKQIEELTYGEGIRLAASCGIDPKSIQTLIGEGRLGVSACLSLQKLKPQQCANDVKNALPNASKLFPKRRK
uniref:Fatty-acid and retinol-binding protein 1 n=1 Tax=Parascaris univalens TaxID=6257 RepID=A0A914ZV50_PARUN